MRQNAAAFLKEHPAVVQQILQGIQAQAPPEQIVSARRQAPVEPTGPTFVDDFGNSNLKENINGFIYGNGPMPTMNVGDKVRWYLMSSTNFEVHAPHWHGNIVTSQHMKTDVINLGTMAMVVADMTVDNPGTWLFHCHIEPHLTAGMQMRYQAMPAVTQAGKAKK